MTHFRQNLLLQATPAAIYAALTTKEGLRGWWSQDCQGQTHPGGVLTFRFGPHHKEMRIEKMEADREVRWRCVGAHIAFLEKKDEWVGTQIVFRLTPEGEGRTRLEFEHVGLVPSFECYEVCDSGWKYFLASLRGFVETGRGTPHELVAEKAS
ncbi:MAG TPA: SRPBCC domain-containing protein [Candidatus Polarisedimenticolaceae bacterium]